LNRSVSIGPWYVFTGDYRSSSKVINIQSPGYEQLSQAYHSHLIFRAVFTSKMAGDNEVHGDEVAKHNSRENVSPAAGH